MQRFWTRWKRALTAAAVFVSVVVAIVGTVSLLRSKSSSDDGLLTPVTAGGLGSPAPRSSTENTSTYRDGDYSATGSYSADGGQEQLTVHVTLSGDIITAASVTAGAHSAQAQADQDAFIANYQAQVLGQDISTLKLGSVSGSNLAVNGFNDALTRIKTQAKR